MRDLLLVEFLLTQPKFIFHDRYEAAATQTTETVCDEFEETMVPGPWWNYVDRFPFDDACYSKSKEKEKEKEKEKASKHSRSRLQEICSPGASQRDSEIDEIISLDAKTDETPEEEPNTPASVRCSPADLYFRRDKAVRLQICLSIVIHLHTSFNPFLLKVHCV